MFPFISCLISKNLISAPFGRFLEATLITMAFYTLGALAEGKVLSVQGAATALLASPVMQGIAKKYRDDTGIKVTITK